MAEKACRADRLIIAQGDTCPICGQNNLTTKWSGYIVILNVEKSELAKKMGLKINGAYALHLND
jgi:DNA-directed RNA polymerase subunit E"